MRSILLRAVVAAAALLFSHSSHATEEACVACDKKVVVSGDFSHARAWGSTVIQGAPRRGDEAFREEIYGTNFTVTVSGLVPGKYLVQIGEVEVDFANPGERSFDIQCGDQVLASNLDICAAAGGTDKAYFVTSPVDLSGNAAGGPLVLVFSGNTNAAKFNSIEIKDYSGQSLVFVRAADLIDAVDAEALSRPAVGTGPEYWKDPDQPVSVRVDDLVRRLSLAEKVQQLRNAAPAIPRLGVPAYNYWNECLHGVARAGTATVFPQAIALAAAWDTPLLHDIAGVIATEARAKHNDYVARHEGNCAIYFGLTFWTPNINIFRDPRWGRGQETYGEDPFLTSRLGVAFIRGLQGDDPKYLKAMACAKHYAVHSGPEPDRHRFNVDPPERDLYETYLPHFEAAVREGHVGAVMGAYNSVDGKPACASPFLLTETLRKSWGFQGHVVSDCGAIYDIFANHKFADTPEEAAADAVKAGCDLCCGTDYNSLVRAVRRGFITEKDLDVALGRVLEARFRLGLFDPTNRVPFNEITLAQNDTPEHEALALRAARESIVLLQNDGLLPLDRSKIKRIAVIGTNANSVPLLLGNYNGTPARPVTILQGIRSVAGPDVEVVYEQGCPLVKRDGADAAAEAEMVTNAVAAARLSDVVIFVGGINSRLEGEEMPVHIDGFNGGDRTRIELPAPQLDMIRALQATGKPVVFVNCSGSAMALPGDAAKLPAIVQAWYPGEQGGKAVAEVLFGDVNPGGRLPITFYRSTDDLPDFEDYSMSNRTYRYFNGQPQFAFGHGLSYTRFEYRDAQLDRTNAAPTETLKLTVHVANTGGRDGDEVAQVYFRHVRSAVPQPRMALCAFARVHLPRDKGAALTFDIPAERFRFWDVNQKRYVVEPGDYELQVGGASDDIRLKLPFRIANP